MMHVNTRNIPAWLFQVDSRIWLTSEVGESDASCLVLIFLFMDNPGWTDLLYITYVIKPNILLRSKYMSKYIHPATHFKLNFVEISCVTLKLAQNFFSYQNDGGTHTLKVSLTPLSVFIYPFNKGMRMTKVLRQVLAGCSSEEKRPKICHVSI